MSAGIAIPGLMLGGPIGGAIAGYFVGGWLGDPQRGIAFGVLGGVAFAAYEVIRVLRRMSSEQDPDRRSRE